MILELLNSLAFAFLLSEKFLVGNSQFVQRLLPRVVAGLVIVNLLLSETVATFLAAHSGALSAALFAISTVFHTALNVTLLPITAVVTFLGAPLLYALEFAAVALLVGLGLQWQGRSPLAASGFTQKALYLAVFLLSVIVYCGLVWWTAGTSSAPGQRALVSAVGSHPEAVRVFVGMFSFTTMSFFDIQRFEPNLTVAQLMKHLSVATLYVLPVIPFLAVGISAVLFFIISIMEWLYLPVDFLGPVVYVMTIYGPFCVIFIEAKRLACKGRYDYLPRSH